MICLCCYYCIKHALSHVSSILPYKEEEEVAKAESEEKIIDPNGDEVFVTAAKHIIEYCITSHYPSISDLLGRTLFSRSCIS